MPAKCTLKIHGDDRLSGHTWNELIKQNSQKKVKQIHLNLFKFSNSVFCSIFINTFSFQMCIRWLVDERNNGQHI